MALLPGAKGSVIAARLQESMRKHPKEFARTIGRNMAHQLEEDPPAEDAEGNLEDEGKCALRYLEQEVVMGKQKVLGCKSTIDSRMHIFAV